MEGTAQNDLEFWRSTDIFPLDKKANVLSSVSCKLVLGLSLLNIALWITTFSLQVTMLTVTTEVMQLILVSVSSGLSAINLIATLVSTPGLFKNHLIHVKIFGIVTLLTGIVSLLIFVIQLVAMNLDFSKIDLVFHYAFPTFTGLFVFGESFIVIWLVKIEGRQFHQNMEDERDDKIRKFLNLQQNSQQQQPIEVVQNQELHEQEERLENMERIKHTKLLGGSQNQEGPVEVAQGLDLIEKARISFQDLEFPNNFEHLERMKQVSLMEALQDPHIEFTETLPYQWYHPEKLNEQKTEQQEKTKEESSAFRETLPGQWYHLEEQEFELWENEEEETFTYYPPVFV